MDIVFMNKDELRAHAKTLGLELDMRKSIDKLQAEVEAYKPVVKKEAPKVKKPDFLKNPKTNFFWPWTKLLEERGDLVPCDENGNDL